MRCPGQAMVCMRTLRLSQQSHSAGHQVIYNPKNTHQFPTNAQLHSVQRRSLITPVWSRWLYYNARHLYTSPLNACFPLLILGRGREGRAALHRGFCVLLCSRARDTFSVITCRHVSMESWGFSHCFLSGLIWWMLSGTQHVSLETSWKSGGHWRHLKGLSEACLCCPGIVFHWGCLLFSFAFLLFCFFPSKPCFLSNISSCFAKLFLLLYCSSVTVIKIDIFYSMSIICCSLGSGVNPNTFSECQKKLCYYQPVNSGLIEKSKKKWLSCALSSHTETLPVC